jgi:hypothetical protein
LASHGQILDVQQKRLATAVGRSLEQAGREVLHRQDAVHAGAIGLVRSATQDLDRTRDRLGHQARWLLTAHVAAVEDQVDP